MVDPEFCFKNIIIIMGDELNPYPGNLKHHRVEETDEMRRKNLCEIVNEMKAKDLTGHSLSTIDDAGVFLFINEQFPVIATGSRADLSEDRPEDKDKRYPIVHAVLRKRTLKDGRIDFYVDFECITSIPDGEGLDYKCPHVNHVRMELLKFVHDTYANKWYYKLDDGFYSVADMSGTLLKSKYTLLPELP